MRVLDLPIEKICTNIYVESDTELSEFDATVLDILDQSNFRAIAAAQYKPEYTLVLSDLRKNCVEWLPIGKNDSVLELGADYGQLTGTLAGKAKSVSCFDFDLTRTGISYVRNREFTNIAYYAYDTFSDFGRKIEDRKFDYIYMADAFSEAVRYFPQSNDPGKAMLVWAKEHLSERGKIVLAVDNKYGFKFINGSRILGEEFYGAPLTGVTSMPQHGYFTKGQLENYLHTAGFARYKFFYPLPEYRFTLNLYSDQYLPRRGELFCHDYTWEYDKMKLLDEKEVFYCMAEDGVFRDYTNSYLVVAAVCADMEDLDSLQYIRFSSGRRSIYDICTSIVCKNGKRIVRKAPRTWYARRHVADICANYKSLTAAYANESVHFNHCVMNGEVAEFDYLEGQNLSFIINGYFSSGAYDRIMAEYDKLFELLSLKAKHFVPSREFLNAFGIGSAKLLTLRAPLISNVDMIPQNIIVTEDGHYHIFDYEWTFPFAVPILYILWRGIMYQFLSDKGFANVLYDRYGIDIGLRKIFLKMESQFEQFCYSQKRPDQYPSIGHIELLRRSVQIFKDYGEGFEKGELYFLDKDFSINGKLVFDVEVNENLKTLRIDPCSQRCLVKINSITDNAGENMPYVTNGTPLKDGCFLYKTIDPQIIIQNCDSLGMNTIHFNMVMEIFLPEIADSVK